MRGVSDLLRDLAAIEPFDEKEAADVGLTAAFLRRDERPFDRKNFAGHVTGSAFVLSPDGKSVLLTHHAALDRWLQLGGHAEQETDMRAVALREAREESGNADLGLVSASVFDVDVHVIPENKRKREPEHPHYDVRFLLQAGSWTFAASEESKVLEWVPLVEVAELPRFSPMRRMALKALR